MDTKTVSTWGIALAFALVLATSFHLDGPSDTQAEWAQSASLQDAVRADAAATRKAKAAAAICGNNAGYFEQADGSVHCSTHKGKRTGVSASAIQLAQVQP